jgi:hypothetical protein
MDEQTAPTLAIVIVLILLVIGALIFMRRRRSDQLKSRFGPEYGRTVDTVGDPRKAEAALAARAKRVSSYSIKPLPAELRTHFTDTWQNVQAQFVDDPKYAVTRADDLLGEVMRARGYPVQDFDQRADDLSVDHPQVVQNYRSAHDIALAHSQGQASTEDLRTAMIHFRALFDELVNDRSAVQQSAPVAEPIPRPG